MKKFLLATVSMVALTSVARAADMPAKAPMYAPVPVTDWAGLYAGVQGGVVRRDTTVQSITPFFSSSQDGSSTGGLGGALLGYNWQQGGFVYGLEGDWNWVGAKASHFTTGQVSSSDDISWLATVRARTGLAIDSTLFYLTGGAAFGHTHNRLDSLNGNGAIFLSFFQKQTKVGWTLGAGIEHEFAPHWTARAELRYVDLGKATGVCILGTQPCAGYRGEFSNSLWQGLVGVNYKFGGGRAADWSHARAYAPPLVSAWAGGYLGIQGGVARHDAFFGDTSLFESRSIDQRKTGGSVGALVGYNWQQGSFVYGVEGGWSWIGAKAEQIIPINGANLSISQDVNWLATLRGRAGLAFDATLLYVAGGVAFGQVKNSLSETQPVSSASFNQDRTKVGWTAGVGIEHMFSRHWTARAEFRYVDLGTSEVACTSADDLRSCVSNNFRDEFSNTLMLGLVGLNYKF